jgi:uncharacterized RDD family membrane protein YckC
MTYGNNPPGGYEGPPPEDYGSAPPEDYGSPPPGSYGNPPPGSYGNPPGGYGNPPPGGYGNPPPGPPGGYGNPPGGYGNPPGGYGNPPGGYPGSAAGYPDPPEPGGYGAPVGYGNAPAPGGYGAPGPVGYGGPPGPGYGSPGDYANWLQRVGAYLIDVIPVVILDVIGRATGSTAIYFLFILVGVGVTAYNRWFQAGRTGQSWGKRVLGITLLSETTGQPIGAGMAFVRDICHVVDGIICFIGYLFPLWDAKRQTLADKIVRTVVLPV